MQVSDDPRVGTELAGYRIETLLGRGGMSVVYLAEDVASSATSRSSSSRPHLAEDETFRERFLRESQLAASIDHPNIVPIYEAGEIDELLFIAMRYVEGADLKERSAATGRSSRGEAIGILAQVASALDAAHARGLVHRDVKPSNVLLDTGAGLDGSDHAYLADFGLTKRLTDASGTGDDGHLMGTIDYVAPEQIAGEDVDGRADVYSLGCVLYECLAGEPPFRRDSDVAVVFAHLEEDRPPLSAERPELPAALDAVIARALAKDPEQRYSTCRELARAALAVTVDEASRAAGRRRSASGGGRSDLGECRGRAGRQGDRPAARARAGPRARADADPRSVAAEGVCPFKGLASFEPADADYFFGRERLVAELVARLVGAGFPRHRRAPRAAASRPCCARACCPRSRAACCPAASAGGGCSCGRASRPLEELRRVLALEREGSRSRRRSTRCRPGERLAARRRPARGAVHGLRATSDERAAFVDMLVRAAGDPQGRARRGGRGASRLLRPLRRLSRAWPSCSAPTTSSSGRCRRPSCAAAIELPAGRVGLRVEPELADALVDDVEGEPGALPLLSTALLELWQKRQDNTLTAGRPTASPVACTAPSPASPKAPTPASRSEHKPLVRAIMLRLVGEGDGDAAVRRRAPLAELDLERDEDAARVLATLADSRLVTVSRGQRRGRPRGAAARVAAPARVDRGGRAGPPPAPPRHPGRHRVGRGRPRRGRALPRRPPRRRPRLERRPRPRAQRARARVRGREPRGLRAGDQARPPHQPAPARPPRSASPSCSPQPSPAASSPSLQRGEARDAAAEARDAETAQLAQRLGAQALVEEDLDRSLLLARQAVEIDDTPQNRGSLLADLQRVAPVVGIMHSSRADPDDVLRFLAVSPDGRTLAVGGAWPASSSFDTETYELRRPAAPGRRAGPERRRWGRGHSRTARTDARSRSATSRLSPPFRRADGRAARGDEHRSRLPPGVHERRVAARRARRRPVVAGVDQRVRDAATLEQIGAPILPAFAGAYVAGWFASPSFALTPDDRSIITASEAGELAWWDMRTGEKTRTLPIADSHRPSRSRSARTG